MSKRLPKPELGTVFNSWTILEQVSHKPRTTYLCVCKCGMRKEVLLTNLRGNKSKSCGKGACKTKPTLSHGMTDTPLHQVWLSMRYRVKNPIGSNECYKGIRICPEWDDFKVFYSWAMASGYKQGLSIDRIKSNLDYCPDNCRWTTALVQSQNRKGHKNAEVPFKGVFKSKPRNGKVKYAATGKAPYYWIVTYKGKRHQKWGFTTAEEAYSDKCKFIRENYDGLVYP